jgi:hypothetical protein
MIEINTSVLLQLSAVRHADHDLQHDSGQRQAGQQSWDSGRDRHCDGDGD